jgi:hypothetical protein
MKQSTTSVSQSLAQKIGLSPLRSQPFGHIYHEDVFPDLHYDEILLHLPESRFYKELRHPDALQPDGTSARLSFNLYPENIRRLPPEQREFWTEFTREMTAPCVETAFKVRFKKILEEHCERRLEQIKLRPWPMLLRDIAGYKISIHPDAPQKAITTQYYLPVDERQKSLGTVLHERLPSGDFTEVRALPFLPNSGYAFAVTTESWHSVKVMSASGPPRNSLMVTYFYDRGWIIEAWKLLARRIRAAMRRANP